jgi:hypothetical protein
VEIWQSILENNAMTVILRALMVVTKTANWNQIAPSLAREFQIAVEMELFQGLNSVMMDHSIRLVVMKTVQRVSKGIIAQGVQHQYVLNSVVIATGLVLRTAMTETQILRMDAQMIVK